MASNDTEYRSVSGQEQTLEPAKATLPKPTLLPAPAHLNISASAGSSPQTSRNTSPIRKDSRPSPLAASISTQPSAAAIQRALSATSIPQLQSGSATEPVSRLPRAAKNVAGGSGETALQWPLSPRLRSPPPSASGSRRGSAVTGKMAESSTVPNISVQPAAPPPTTSSPQTLPKPQSEDARRPDQQLQAPIKVSSRGPSGKSTLETVQENGSDVIESSPAALQASTDLKPVIEAAEQHLKAKDTNEPERLESGSESAGNKSDSKRGRASSITQSTIAASKPKAGLKNSYAGLTSAKSRQGDGKQNMTVETETVASIPQSALNALGDRGAAGRGDPSGSLRLARSNETIRPKKERKKASHKSRSINQGTGKSVTRPARHSAASSREEGGGGSSSGSFSTARHDLVRRLSETLQRANDLRRTTFGTPSNKRVREASSKADIFEARVANAVGEVNTSDSDETFVYESNPPEAVRRSRHHSRTPSVTSSHSTTDQRGGIRNFADMLDDRKVGGKRSMKFSSNQHHDIDSPDSKTGTVRSHHARHIGKFGRSGGHASVLDSDSPFTQASKARSNHLGSMTSMPKSPRSPNPSIPHNPSGLFGRKHEHSFDFDGEGADDERTPLVGSVRTPRSVRQARRLHSTNSQQTDDYYGVERSSRFYKGAGGCCLAICVFVAVVAITVFLLFMSNRPLKDLKIRKLENILATEQEVMLDLIVGAINPNALGVSITDMDINVFASSKHAGSKHPSHSTSETQSQVRHRRPLSLTTGGGVDHGTDPMPDDGAPTVLLGRIFQFDVPLTFESQVFSRQSQRSKGTLQLMKPGNKTESGGSERWARVLQHPFELIVRGKFIYQLPISATLQSVAVEATVLVHPEEGIDGMGHMRIEPMPGKEGIGDEAEWE